MQADLRQELREQLQAMWQDKLSRLTVSLPCDCGQEVVITGGAVGAFVHWLAQAHGAEVVPADESATCPNCGAYMFPAWNASAGRIFEHLGPSIEDTIDELAEAGRLAQAIEELKADAQAKRDRRAGAN